MNDSRQEWQQWLTFKNTSSEIVPARGVLAIDTSAGASVEGVPYLNASKPSTTFCRLIAVNGPERVKAGKFGRCTFSPTYVKIDDSTPSVGEGWGPKADSWGMAKNYPAAFTVLGDNQNGASLCLIHPINTLIGKLAGALSQGSSATVNIWVGAGGSESASSSLITLPGFDWLMKSGADDIASGKKVKCDWINGIWYVTQAECA